MNISVLVNLLIIISALQNYLTVTVYAYEEPLAKLWNVSYSELPELLGYEKNLTEVDRSLDSVLDEYDTIVGGTFIDVPTNKIYITVLNNQTDLVKRIIDHNFSRYNHLFVYEPVKNSIATLKETFDQILNLANRTRPLTTTCVISIEYNHVILKTNEQNREFLDAIRQISQYNETVLLTITKNKRNTQPPFVETNNMEIDTINIRDINTRFMAGGGLYIINPKTKCSLGFLAKSKDEKSNYFVTAGHCFRSTNSSFYYVEWNSKKWSDLIGPMELYNVGPLDVGLISIRNPKVMKYINTVVVIRNTDSLYNKELIVEDYAIVSSYGAHICKSGFITYVTCGKIKGVNGFNINKNGDIKYPVIISDQETSAGDSGAPLFSYKQDLRHVSLIGIHSSSSTGLAISIPLEGILRMYDLKLMLSGSSSSSSNTS